MLAELIANVNDLFEGDLTPGDKLVYVNDVIKGKLMESKKLAEQALNNTKEQFDNSPDLDRELEGAIMDALAAHSTMSKQALESAALRADLKSVLPGRWQAVGRAAREGLGGCASMISNRPGSYTENLDHQASRSGDRRFDLRRAAGC